jgi:hypothetical protein
MARSEIPHPERVEKNTCCALCIKALRWYASGWLSRRRGCARTRRVRLQEERELNSAIQKEERECALYGR